MSKSKNSVYIENNVLNLNNKSILTISADYPYYRDIVSNWQIKLLSLKKLGIKIITFYIPWRHHAFMKNGHQVFDFTGKTQPNRNVLKFINICNSLNLYVVIKPGPFIHAETKCGGFPDFTLPGNDSVKCEAQMNYKKIKRIWWNDNYVPSPVCPIFEKMVKDWYTSVDIQVLKPNIYSKGPIISIQICNEGLYTDSGAGPLDFDYSNSSIKLYQKYCKNKYKTIANYNKLHKTQIKTFGELDASYENELPEKIHNKKLLELIDWRMYQDYFTTTVLKRYSSYIKTPVTKVTNAALPYKMNKCADYWICRNSYYNNIDVHQGFTNWVGLVSHDKAAFDKYYFSIKYNKGINWEENWGFSQLYDKNYKYSIVPYYQTLLAIALGAKGFNVYTGVATSNWDKNIVQLNIKPYPKTPPVNDNGTLGKKADILSKITKFFRKENDEYINSKKETQIVFLWDLYYSASVSFDKLKNKKLQHIADFKIQKKLFHFCQKNNIDIDVMNVYCDDLRLLKKYEYFVVPSAFFMSKKMQQQIIKLIKNGKKILFYGTLPKFDEFFQICTLLSDFIEKQGLKNIIKLKISDCKTETGWGKIMKNLNISPIINNKKYQLFVQRYFNKKTHTSFYFFFSRTDKNQEVRLDVPEGLLEFNLTSRSAMVFKINNGKIVTGIIKSVNEKDKKMMPIKLLLNGQGQIENQSRDLQF